MKMKSIVLVMLMLTSMLSSVVAQDYSDLEKISLKNKAECADNENRVLECCDYLLKSPISAIEEDKNHLSALQFIMRWMEATPDYSFGLDESIGKATGSHPSLLGIMLASMSKYALENKTDDVDDVKYNSFVTFVKYCEDPANNVKLNKELKELIKAKNDNTLKEYLKIGSGGMITRL